MQLYSFADTCVSTVGKPWSPKNRCFFKVKHQHCTNTHRLWRGGFFAWTGSSAAKSLRAKDGRHRHDSTNVCLQILLALQEILLIVNEILGRLMCMRPLVYRPHSSSCCCCMPDGTCHNHTHTHGGAVDITSGVSHLVHDRLARIVN